MGTPVTDRLPAISVLRMLAALLLVIGPHFTRLPPWASIGVLALVAWRGLAAHRGWPLPSNWLRVPLTLLTFIGIYASYGSLNGQNPGVALLIVMVGLKLTEMGARRDYTIVLFLCYFLLVTHFLYSQEIIMIVYLFGTTIAITAVLIEINHPQGPLPLRTSARHASMLVAQGLPIMLLFFLLFPRIPGPIWGLPADAGAGRTGLSDRMEPGLISSLSKSDEVAFRVNFLDTPPDRSRLYWRGPVFDYFDGRAWEEGFRYPNLPQPKVREIGEGISYEMVLEPHGRRTMLALDVPTGPLPTDTALDIDYQLLSRNQLIDRRLLKLTSHLDYELDIDVDPRVKRLALRLPRSANPAARELARFWKESAEDDWAVVQSALQYFRDEPFVYTMEPPLLRSRLSPIDEFLFETRRGFCEHYASAFTALMRAADIPARVVTGYQGGEEHLTGGYFIVRQSDAHAWSEVWIEGRGWVRVDPTGAVSPTRIELGLGAAMPAGEPVPGLARFNRGLIEAAQLRWDLINASWNRWVLSYGPELQRDLLRVIGLRELRDAILLLTVGCVLLLVIVSLTMIWNSRPTASAEHVFRLWLRFRRKLARRGIEDRPAEGPLDLGHRIANQAPNMKAAADPIVALYVRLRYGPVEDPQLLSQFKRRVKRFPSTL